MNANELKFKVTFENDHPGFKLVFEPGYFKLDIGGATTYYKPDFYCPENGTFYEVVGSKNAFQSGKLKIRFFLQQYPSVKLRIVRPGGQNHNRTLEFTTQQAYEKCLKARVGQTGKPAIGGKQCRAPWRERVQEKKNSRGKYIDQDRIEREQIVTELVDFLDSSGIPNNFVAEETGISVPTIYCMRVGYTTRAQRRVADRLKEFLRVYRDGESAAG